MLVNYIQIAYVLGISTKKAKLMVQDNLERFKNRKKGEYPKSVSISDEIESSLLKAIFHHPSPELDGKDMIAYTINKLQEGGGKYQPEKENRRGYVLLETWSHYRKVQPVITYSQTRTDRGRKFMYQKKAG